MLASDWFMQEHLDYEYQYFKLKAYEQKVINYFNSLKLYPYLSDAIKLYNETKKMLENLESINYKVDELYKEKYEEGIANYLYNILHKAEEIFSNIIQKGISIYEELKRAVKYTILDVTKQYNKEAILIIGFIDMPEFYIAHYENKNIFIENERYILSKLEVIEKREDNNIVIKAEKIKDDICNRFDDYKMLNFYLVTSSTYMPFEETYSEIIKREMSNVINRIIL